ncbi:MAG: DUF1778 domain-containing protein [bacterium]
MRQEKIEVKALAQERRDIAKAAEILHMTVSKFVRDAVIKRTKAIIEQQDDIVLSDKDKKIFLRALDATIKPNLRLRKAAKQYLKK